MTMSAVELRPRSVGELLGLTFELYRRNFPLFVGITAIVAVPVLVLLTLSNLMPTAQFALVPGITDESSADGLSAAIIGLTALTCCMTGLALIAGVFWPWMEGALTHSVIERVLGRAPGLRASYGQTRPRFASLWGSNLLANIGLSLPFAAVYGLFLVGLVAAGVFVAASGDSSSGDGSFAAIAVLSVVCLPVVIGVIVLTIILAINWAFRVPAIVGEGVGAIQAFGRSTALARGDRWRILGRYIVLALIEFVLVALPMLIVIGLLTFGLFAAVSAGQTADFERASLPGIIAISVIAAAISFFATLLITPVRVIYTAVNYLDMRIRKENLALQMADAALVAVDTSSVVPDPLAVAAVSAPSPALTPAAVVASVVVAAPPVSAPTTPTALTEPIENLPPGQRVGVLFNRLRTDGENAQVLNSLGMAYMEIGDTWGAIEAFTRGRAVAPDDADLAYNLMLVRIQTNDMTAARQLMSEYLRLETNADDAARVRNTPRFKDLLPE